MRRTLLAGLVLLAGAAAVEAAPAPATRASARWLTPREVEGEWLMHWGDTLARVTLHGDGRYQATLGGTRYTGTWAWTAGGGLLVTESLEGGAQGESLTWAVQFQRDGRGRLDRTELSGTATFGGGLPVRLTRAGGALTSARP
jgi:hypothetical protein